MTIEAPDYYKICCPHSEIFDMPAALRLMQLGNTIAEIEILPTPTDSFNILKVYRMVGADIFQVNIHLGTLVKTNAFDYEHINSARKFIRVELEVIKGSSEVPPILCREDMKKVAGIEDEQEIQTFEINTPPMFFETNEGDLISKDFIFRTNRKFNGNIVESAKLTILGHHYEYHLDEQEEIRFRKFAELHGIFGKDQ